MCYGHHNLLEALKRIINKVIQILILELDVQNVRADV